MTGILGIMLAAAFSTAAPASFTPPREAYWLKTYAVSPYRETWNAELEVKKIDRDLPKILKIIDKAGAHLTQPLENFPASRIDHSQQLAVSVPARSAEKLMARLRKFGDMREPLKRPLAEPVPIEEVREKIARLMKEKTDRAAQLTQVPVSAEASEEVLEDLLRVEAAAVRSSETILLNLTVRNR